MEYDERIEKFNEIFRPRLKREYDRLTSENLRFAYYTSASTAVSIIRNRQLWFRNALVMNDFAEVEYGLRLIEEVLSGSEGARFRQSIDDIFPDTIEQVDMEFQLIKSSWRFDTYLACISVHSPKEDHNGRLSMWRAYGDTALVANNAPLIALTDKLKVYSLPVLYLSKEDMTTYFAQITNSVLINRRYLQSLGQATLVSHVMSMLFQFAIATKHPGFAEEQEWRLFYRPTDEISPAMIESIEIVNNLPQKVYKLRLDNDPEIGLFGADIPTLLERLIIGPSEFPYVSFHAFKNVLDEAGVKDSFKKIVFSDIPLRTR